MNGNHVVENAMLVTIGENGQEEIIPLDVQEIEIEAEEYIVPFLINKHKEKEE